MKLESFDQLKQTSEQLIVEFRQVKYRNIKLEKENEELRRKLDSFEKHASDVDLNEIEKILTENERLKTRNIEAKKELEKLVSEIEQKNL